MSNVTQLANSLEEYWMPFTANRAFKANPRIMTGASGVYYTSHQGRQIIDGSSGLFCVAAGHGRPVHREVVAAEDHVLGGGHDRRAVGG